MKINDKPARLICILIPMALSLYLNGWYKNETTGKSAQYILLTLAAIILTTEGSRFIIYKSRYVFRHKPKSWLRPVAVIVTGILYVTLVISLYTISNFYLKTDRWMMPSNIASNIYVNGVALHIGLFGLSLMKALLYFPALFLLFETSYYFARMRYTEQEKEKLEKEKMRAELFYLKEIVNPHFLFNSLNSLSALIHENPQQAEQFLDELTKVYRYLLRNNDGELTELSTEVKFIQSYIHLLKTRYSESIQFDIQIDNNLECYLLPPLTLQLLVENAVKHNRLMKEQPLRIQIYTRAGEELVVSNNVQKKDTPVDSTKVGLQNINARYRLLNQTGIMVEQNDQHFSVIVRLIKS